jgi:hypothetical protein
MELEMKILAIFKLLVIISVVSACANQYPEMDSPAPKNNELAESKDVKECKSNKNILLSEYDKKILVGDYAGAARGLEKCADILKDSNLIEKTNEAMAVSFLKIADNKSYSANTRKAAIDNLGIQYPQEFAKNKEEIDQINAVLVVELQKKAAQEKKKRKNEGVSIGMTQEEVIQSSWGKPRDINRTTNRYGVREQWVYGGGNYLYFEDGILTSIQN